jgi:predicted nuclease of predicted toxin-antitoxin system
LNIKFILDENIPFAFIELLNQKGYETQHLKKIGKTGIKNGEVYQLAEQEKSWIVTRDADFQNLQKYYAFDVAGIILFKLTNTKTENLLRVMEKFIETHSDDLRSKHLIIIEDKEIRRY